MMSWGLLLSLVPSVIAMKVLDHATYYEFQEYRDRCTAIAAGKLATADGSTITTHNNDCVECDIRITKVPARDWPEGSKRPIQPIRAAYPRYVENPEDSIHGPDYYIGNVDMTIYPWNATEPYYFIDQVKHTYAYTLGAYAIQNEKQVSIGESTCSSIFVATPVFDGGKAVMHLETLTELALERCDTARCAIQLMGDLAVQYGFFGPEWDGNLNAAQDESGEALTVSDPNEAWMFHIMPDDTGASAIWVAQRVPDDHIAVVANQFVIGDIDLTDTNNFLGSSNIHSIAERHHLWSASSGKKLNFMRTFGTNREHMAFGCTRRVWRVMTLAAPSLLPVFSPYTDGMQTFGYGPNLTDPYPFSVKPDKPLTVQDVMNMNRDQYESTEFDMSHNLDAGFFGDTLRYPPTSVLKDPINGISYQEYEESLGFQRAISLFRTAYSTVTQSRRNLPDVVGAVTWIAPYAPHHSTFVPIYAAAQKAPTSMNVGTQHKFDSRSNWWIHSITGNYLSRWYQHTIGDVQVFQKELETKMFAAQKQMEDHAKQLAEDNASAAIDLITDFQETTAASVRDSWWQFFYRMVGKYRDIYIVENPHAESFSSAFRFMTFSRSWLEIMGFWGVPGTPPHDKTTPMAVKPINVPTYDNMKAYQHAYTPYPAPSVFYQDSTDAVNEGSTSDGGDSSGGKRRHMDPVNTAVPSTMPTNSPTVLSTVKPTTTAEQVISVTSGVFYGSIVAGIVGGIIVGATIMWFVSKRTDYLPLR